jgi:hypothetical protein
MKKRDSISKRCEDLDFKTAPYSTVLRMYADFCDQAGDVHGGTNGASLNVAVAYEDYSAGVHAMRTFQGLFDANERPFQFDMRNAWKFDFLRITELREAAITETVRADLIIVSTHTARDLPATVKWWIETALKRREGDPGALVLLYDENRYDGSMQPPAEAYLTHCAQKGGLDFFVKRAGARPHSKEPAFGADPKEPVAVRIRPGGGLARPMCENQRFGTAEWELRG